MNAIRIVATLQKINTTLQRKQYCSAEQLRILRKGKRPTVVTRDIKCQHYYDSQYARYGSVIHKTSTKGVFPKVHTLNV